MKSQQKSNISFQGYTQPLNVTIKDVVNDRFIVNAIETFYLICLLFSKYALGYQNQSARGVQKDKIEPFDV